MTTKTEATVKTVSKKESKVPTKPVAKKYTVKDLSEKLGTDGKKTRKLLRVVAAQNEGPRFRVVGKSYEWNGKDFPVVLKQVTKLLEAVAASCPLDCQTSAGKDCECHCQGANHGKLTF